MRKKTVFILGAGFSRHAKFPLAGELYTIIEDKENKTEGEKQFGLSYFQKVWSFYENIKSQKQIPFEELWIALQKDDQSCQPNTFQYWLRKYFGFAITYGFLRRSYELDTLPEAYNHFFNGIVLESTDTRSSDVLLYMNWDPLPELYSGVCRSKAEGFAGTPRFYSVGASSNHTTVKLNPGISVYRPAGGIHLLQIQGGMVPKECFSICEDPNFYCLKDLNPKEWLVHKDVKGDKRDDGEDNPENNGPTYLVFPGADPIHHPFTAGQLRELGNHIEWTERVIISGYSFPEYDVHIREHIEDWVEHRGLAEKEIILVDPDKKKRAYRYLSSLVSEKNILLIIKNFEDSFLSKQKWNA